MNRPFLHHRYMDLPPRDVSGNGNDGVGHNLTAGTGPLAGTAGFNGSTSWVEVPRSASMDNLGQFQGRVVFKVDPAAPANRLNLVEGFVSFAIVINADRSVSFTIVDRNGQWRGCTSAPGLASAGAWHTVIAAHDGISEARIGLDAAVVARATDVLGPVRSVGQLGVAIGRWPDAAVYQFRGYVSEVALCKFDPVPEINVIFGADCVDREVLTALFRRMATRLGEDGLAEWARAVQEVLQEVAQAVQTRQRDTDEHRERAAATVVALGTRDKKAFENAFNDYRKHASSAVRTRQFDELRRRFAELTRRMPLNDDERRELARALCLDQLIRDR
jgi:hypothetical protein